MDLIYLILVVAILGVVVWAVTTYLPMPPMFRNLIILIAILVVALWLLGQLGAVPSLRIGR